MGNLIKLWEMEIWVLKNSRFRGLGFRICRIRWKRSWWIGAVGFQILTLFFSGSLLCLSYFALSMFFFSLSLSLCLSLVCLWSGRSWTFRELNTLWWGQLWLWAILRSPPLDGYLKSNHHQCFLGKCWGHLWWKKFPCWINSLRLSIKSAPTQRNRVLWAVFLNVLFVFL